MVDRIVGELDSLYPAKSSTPELRSELCQVLLALDAPRAVAETMHLLAAASTLEEQVAYVVSLRTIKDGWTPELRREYFAWWPRDRSTLPRAAAAQNWWEDAGTGYRDGASYAGFLARFHADARSALSPDEEAALADVLEAYAPPSASPSGGRRQDRPRRVHSFVKAWAMGDLEPTLPRAGKGRSFGRGREAFEAAKCLACHKLGSEGGSAGSDLTAVASRFTRRDMLESILEPSKVVSEQYANSTFHLADGGALEGRVVEESSDTLTIRPNPLGPETTTVKKADVVSRGLSEVSPMPEGLADILTEDEVLDLIAYMEAGGKRERPAFGPRGR